MFLFFKKKFGLSVVLQENFDPLQIEWELSSIGGRADEQVSRGREGRERERERETESISKPSRPAVETL